MSEGEPTIDIDIEVPVNLDASSPQAFEAVAVLHNLVQAVMLHRRGADSELRDEQLRRFTDGCLKNDVLEFANHTVLAAATLMVDFCEAIAYVFEERGLGPWEASDVHEVMQRSMKMKGTGYAY